MMGVRAIVIEYLAVDKVCGAKENEKKRRVEEGGKIERREGIENRD